MANRIEAILEGKDVQPQNSYEAALKQHVASGGGSGGGGAWLESTMDMQTGTLVVDMPIDAVIEAMRNGVLGFVQSVEIDGSWSLSRFYFQVALNQSGDKKIGAAQSYGAATNEYEGTENESGKTVFRVVS